MYTTQLVKVKDIAGVWYSRAETAKTLVLFAPGAPNLPDNGNQADKLVFEHFDTDLFVFDYIGFGRSDGVFTPTNCIQTIVRLWLAFRNGCTLVNAYNGLAQVVQYERVIVIGKSLGGTYVPIVPRFCPEIVEIATLNGVYESRLCGTMQPEETNDQFLRSMKDDGFHHLYRGVLKKEWIDHLENRDDLAPVHNIQHLQSVTFFIAHGMKDTCVHFSRAQDFFDQIKRAFPDKSETELTLRLYPNGDHGISTTNDAVRDCLRWFGVEEL